MADEKELTELSPMDRARRVAGNVMQYIRDNPRKGYGGTTGLSVKEAGLAGELLDNTAEAREFIESPGLGTAAMAGLGLTGIPAKEIAGGAKAAFKRLNPGQKVDGREVIFSDAPPNMDSIAASFSDYSVRPGLQEVSMSEFPGLTGKHYSAAGTKRIKELAGEIKESNTISPLIVAIDDEGPYILEGATRVEALHRLGAKSFPAKVVDVRR